MITKTFTVVVLLAYENAFLLTLEEEGALPFTHMTIAAHTAKQFNLRTGSKIRMEVTE